MPGVIDGHPHAMINDKFPVIESNLDITDLAVRATVVRKQSLMHGLSTVRDMGGPTFRLKRNIDAGIIMGPRLYPAGAFISQIFGHGDFSA